eukprot:IDg6927t1
MRKFANEYGSCQDGAATTSVTCVAETERNTHQSLIPSELNQSGDHLRLSLPPRDIGSFKDPFQRWNLPRETHYLYHLAYRAYYFALLIGLLQGREPDVLDFILCSPISKGTTRHKLMTLEKLCSAKLPTLREHTSKQDPLSYMKYQKL